MSSASGIFVVAGISPSMMTAVAFSFATSAPARRSPASSGAPIASASTRPRCRTPTVSVAFGAIRPSPPSTACVRPGTSQPEPEPAQRERRERVPESLDGRNASPTNPAASNSGARGDGERRRELGRERPREQGRGRDRAHDRGALDRREAEHVDHEQDAEEQRRRRAPPRASPGRRSPGRCATGSAATPPAGSRRRARRTSRAAPRRRRGPGRRRSRASRRAG